MLDRAVNDVFHFGEGPGATIGREAEVVHHDHCDDEHADQDCCPRHVWHAEIGQLCEVAAGH
jgi:hypothetical protein